MKELEVEIRKYEEKDRGSIREICCDTGFLGNPIDRIFKDRELFADLFASLYLDLEPVQPWVTALWRPVRYGYNFVVYFIVIYKV